MSDPLSKFGWRINPFSFTVYPHLFIYDDKKIGQIASDISSGRKFLLFLGRPGAGKTTLLRWLELDLSKSFRAYYLPHPPASGDELLQFFVDRVLRPSRFTRFFKRYSLYSLPDELRSMTDSRIILLIDELHEAPEEVLSWLRSLLDSMERITIVGAGLPEFRDSLESKYPALLSRLTSIEVVPPLSFDHAVDLVRGRIREAGGADIFPFTMDALRIIHQEGGGAPREILRLCDRAVLSATDSQRTVVDVPLLEEGVTRLGDQLDRKSVSLPMEQLTSKQEAILRLLIEKESMSPSQLVHTVDLKDYQSPAHALRSINNIMKRLLDAGFVGRRKKGRSYLYYVAEHIKEELS